MSKELTSYRQSQGLFLRKSCSHPGLQYSSRAQRQHILQLRLSRSHTCSLLHLPFSLLYFIKSISVITNVMSLEFFRSESLCKHVENLLLHTFEKGHFEFEIHHKEVFFFLSPIFRIFVWNPIDIINLLLFKLQKSLKLQSLWGVLIIVLPPSFLAIRTKA